MDSASLVARANRHKRAVADQRPDTNRRPSFVDNDRSVRTRLNTSQGKLPVIQTHPNSSNIPSPPTRSSPLNPNSGVRIGAEVARTVSTPPPFNDEIPFTRKRQRMAPGEGGGVGGSGIPSWEMPGFVKSSNPELGMALAEELARVPAISNLGVYGEQPPFLGLGFIERIVNCDTLKQAGDAGESYQLALGRLGSGLSEVCSSIPLSLLLTTVLFSFLLLSGCYL
jgi:hypothetical protein